MDVLFFIVLPLVTILISIVYTILELAGIGRVHFYEKGSYAFVALGHAIQDIDTGELVEIL